MARVSINEERPTSLAKLAGRPFLFKDQDGLTRFYANGPCSRGYLVPDARRERALRDAIQRFGKIDTIFDAATAILVTISIPSLGGQHGDRALAVLTVTIAINAFGRVLERSWYFDELVAGLERTEPLDTVGRRRANFILPLLGIAYCAFVLWRILKAADVV